MLRKPTHRSMRAFTLLELLIVLALIGFVYAVAMPSLTMRTGTQVANALGRLGQDVRSVYDLAILTNMPHRMVFNLFTGEYWVEICEEPDIRLTAPVNGTDSPSIEEERRERFETDFEKYQDLAGHAVKDLTSDEEIPASSPVIEAKAKLKGPGWSRLKGMEWGQRLLGEQIGIRSMQAEHHERKISIEEDGKDAIAYVYVFPGYIERAVFYIYYRISEFSFDMEQAPYTVLTRPYKGELDIRAGFTEVDMRSDDESIWGL